VDMDDFAVIAEEEGAYVRPRESRPGFADEDTHDPARRQPLYVAYRKIRVAEANTRRVQDSEGRRYDKLFPGPQSWNGTSPTVTSDRSLGAQSIGH